MIRFTTLFLILLITVVPTDASEYCFEPSMDGSPPSAPGTYSKPSAPYCLSGYKYSGKHTCDRWEIDNFINEINDYIGNLNYYAEEARSYANEAIEFANDAADYAS